MVAYAFVFTPKALARSYSDVTYSAKITSALQALEGSKSEWVLDQVLGQNLSGKPVKIMFKNLALISPDYRDLNALACKDAKGNLYILISPEHVNAPKEAIASLICHEIIHQDDLSSISEETRGWTNEAIQWIEFTSKNSALSQDSSSLANRLNKLSEMYREAGNTSRLIRLAVMSIDEYSTLAMSSPGF